MVLACTVTICLGETTSHIPEIKIVKSKPDHQFMRGRQNVDLHRNGTARIEFALSTHYRAIQDAENQKRFEDYISKSVSKDQFEYMKKGKLWGEINSRKGLSPGLMRRTANLYAVSLKDAKTIISGFISFFNEIHEKNRKNLPSDLRDAKETLNKLKQSKHKAEQELIKVKDELNNLRKYPKEYTEPDMDRVKGELGSLRFLAKKADIEIAGIQARVEKAKAILTDNKPVNPSLRQQVLNIYTEAEINLADAQARKTYMSKLIEQYNLGIKLYQQSVELPKTISSLSRQRIPHQTSHIEYLEKQIANPEEHLAWNRKPLSLIDITIYDDTESSDKDLPLN
jgi:hypothetical protein